MEVINMNILVAKDYEEMSEKAAHIVVGKILNKPDSVLGLATGSTPIGLYRKLRDFYNCGLVSFAETITFNLDEYIGLSADCSQSYAMFMKKNLFDYIDIKLENCNIPSGTINDRSKECQYYEKKIKTHGGIDLQILGIGRNGHIGFNEPDVKFEAQTHIVKLDEQTIFDNARFFERSEDVPKSAISMGIKTIMQSRKIVLLASGKEKADAVFGMVKGQITPKLPASVLQLHPNVTLIVDEDAYSKINNNK
jgi:glucosamine-6-phosphate deaminase